MRGKMEEQQKKNIALLFDMVKMSSELNSSFEKLKQMQSRMVVLFGSKADLMIVTSPNIL